ncbi:flagellar basal body rod protein FlgB [Vibrio breoganii]
MINFDDALGLHPQMLQFRASRMEVIASNIANVDTPGYQAKSLSFDAAMAQASKGSDLGIQEMYRIPMQKSRTGNTVELFHEQAAFQKNAMEYEQTMKFLKSKVSGINKAITGR